MIDACSHPSYPGVAFWVWGETDEGKLLCSMVGDDRKFLFDPEEVTPLERDEFCSECGQIGCRAYQGETE